LPLLKGICAPAAKLIANTASVESYKLDEYVAFNDTLENFELLVVAKGAIYLQFQDKPKYEVFSYNDQTK